MKKSMIFKRIVVTFLVVLLSFESFASTVGDNDGAAFITKAEFDALKAEFDSQIEKYNSSLDNKIDGKISDYVNGLHLGGTYILNPLVSNYKDIKWKNDLYAKVKTREWSNYNTFTDTALGWQIPKFGEFMIIRAGRFYFHATNFYDIENYTIELRFNHQDVKFKADDGWFPSGEGYGTGPRNVDGPLVLYCQEGNNGPELAVNGLVYRRNSQMRDTAYGSILFGSLYYASDGVTRIGNNVTVAPDGYMEQLPVVDSKELLRWKLKFYFKGWDSAAGTEIGPYWTNELYIHKDYSGYGSFEWGDVVVNTNLPNTMWPDTNLGEFGKHFIANYWPSVEQRDREQATLRNMFLGNSTDTKVNCAIELKKRKFSPNTSYDFGKSELGSFNVRTFCLMTRNGLGRGSWFGARDSSGVNQLRFSLPLWPKYYLRELINPSYKYNGNGLAIGGGIPIAEKILTNGTLKIKLKYSVGTDDVTATSTPQQNIYMSFKKTNFNDSTETDNYYEDENGNSLKDKLWEPTTTDTTYEVNIPVKADDNVWFRIGPKDRTASGLYAQISDLDVRLITE